MPELVEVAPEIQPVSGLKSGQVLKDWLEKMYPKLKNGGYEYFGNEPNTDPETKWDTAPVRILICRLSTYQTTEGSMTQGLLAQLVHEHTPEAFVDFAYMPNRDDYRKFIEEKVPLWFGLTSKRLPTEFDIVIISLAIVTEMYNIPALLIKSGIPMFKTQRKNQWPLIIIGGIGAYNHEVLNGSYKGESCIPDCAVFGEGEVAIPQLLDLYLSQKKKDKTTFLREAHDKIDGFYEADKYDVVYHDVKVGDKTYSEIKEIKPNVDYVAKKLKKAMALDISHHRTLEVKPLSFSGGFNDTADVQISEGCGGFCSFCQEGWITRPYRERSLEKIVESAREARRHSGATSINFYCVGANSLVFTSYGLSTIKGLWTDEFESIPEDKLLSMKKSGRVRTRFGFENFDYAICRGVKSGWKFTFEYGIEMIYTRDHKMEIEENGILKFIEAEKVMPGQNALLVTTENLFSFMPTPADMVIKNNFFGMLQKSDLMPMHLPPGACRLIFEEIQNQETDKIVGNEKNLEVLQQILLLGKQIWNLARSGKDTCLTRVEVSNTDKKVIQILNKVEIHDQEFFDIVETESHTFAPNSISVSQSLNWNHYSRIYSLIRQIMTDVGEINLISNRADVQARDESLASLMYQVGNGHTTVGVEGASERLRHFLHKNVTEDDVKNAVRYLTRHGINEIKLFFIATGLEEEQDLDELIALLGVLKGIVAEEGKKTAMRVSFTPLFSTTGSPLQFAPCYSSLAVDSRSLDKLIKACREFKIGFRTSAKKASIHATQLLMMGDRRLTPLIVKASLEKQFIDYGLFPKDLGEWLMNTVADLGLDINQYWREKDDTYIFPNDHVKMGADKKFLWETYKQVRDFGSLPYCLKIPKDGDKKCHKCGSCRTKEQVDFITKRELDAPVSAEEVKQWSRQREKYSQIRFLIEIEDPKFRVVPKRFYTAAIGRAFMLADPENEKRFVKVMSQSRTTAANNMQLDWTYGKVLIDVSVNEHMSPGFEDKLVEEMNKYTSGYRVLGAKVADSMGSLNSTCQLALYEVELSGLALLKVRSKIEQYFEKSVAIIKKKVQVNKGVFRSVTEEIGKQQIVTLLYQQARTGPYVLFLAANSLNPYAILESMTGYRQSQLRPSPVKCLGYYSRSVSAGSAEFDLFSSLMGVSNICSCGGSIETDVFTGDLYKSQAVGGLCVSCDMEQLRP